MIFVGPLLILSFIFSMTTLGYGVAFIALRWESR